MSSTPAPSPITVPALPATLEVGIEYSQIAGFPAGEAIASAVLTLTGAVSGALPPIPISPEAASVTVTFPAADTYSFSIEALDAAGNQLGGPYTGIAGTLEAPVTLRIPTSVSIIAPAAAPAA